MAKMITIIITLLCLTSVDGFAAFKKVDINLKNVFQERIKEIKSLETSLSSLETELSSQNAEYINTLKARQELEDNLATIQNDLKIQATEIDKKLEKLSKLAKSLLLQKIDDNPASLLSTNVLQKCIKKETDTLKQKKIEMELLQKDSIALQERLSKYKETESVLMETLNRLEAEKEEYAKKYITANEEKNSIKQKLANVKVKTFIQSKKTTINPALNPDYISPVENYVGFEQKQNNGVSFQLTNTQPIKNPKDGKILFVGDISPYGNVVMVGHDNQSLSVLVGDFVPTLAKGDTVKSGEIIGYAKVNSGLSAKLDYEIRYKNIIQDTSGLLDKKTLVTNKATSL